MKGLYSLLFVILIQACLNSSDDGYIITIDDQNQLTLIDCTSQQYGFAFLATTSGFIGETTITFYLDSPYYNRFVCTVPKTEEGYQTIECYADSNIFPLFEQTSLPLPETLNIPDVTVEGWNLLTKSPLNFAKCVQLEPTNTFNTKEQFTNECDSSGNNVISVTGSFSDNIADKKIFLTSTDEDSTTYSFEPYLIVDGKIAKAYCEIKVLNTANGGDDKLTCLVNGKENGLFFDTVAALKLVEGTDQGAVRMKPTYSFNLQYCKSCFMKLSVLLLISLFLL